MTAPSRHTGPTGATALAAQLESYGVEYVFGTCGHTNIALLDAIGRTGVTFVIARHEQAAAHAADGYARTSGKPGVLLMHAGPGMMNACDRRRHGGHGLRAPGRPSPAMYRPICTVVIRIRR